MAPLPPQVDALLAEVMPACKERGGDWYIKAIQALGFCRWKQYVSILELEKFACFLVFLFGSSMVVPEKRHAGTLIMDSLESKISSLACCSPSSRDKVSRASVIMQVITIVNKNGDKGQPCTMPKDCLCSEDV